ncbi:transglycosylase-like protein with SLT domain [Herbihabitans rhizosphaerae]|uniref:Transglycosylase-like protein with SLT domain n=1 Tax=Herbihabitans rhizosphaerae TaxID=1872711 RepID=A0A4Q7KW02_9PSEU|nr:transglycosylase SLT domain-containing protein [Herbihabitans rhizosphaerae]RZS40827.1 transglycosylase-like protein with SLT domain [Herbihabitans rhizosphaerae]
MLSYENLYHAPVHGLKQAVDEWNQVAGKLESLGSEMKSSVGKPITDSRWGGKAAQSAQSFIGETTKEFGDAVKQARGIHRILNEAHARIKENQDALYRIADHEAPAKGLKVDMAGNITAKFPFDINDKSTWRGQTKLGNGPADAHALKDKVAADERHAIEAIKTRINHVLRAVSEVDQTAAWALRGNLGNDKHDFNQPTHTSIGGAWNAGAWKLSVTGKGSFLEPYGPEIIAAAKKYGINPKVLAALLIQEGEGRTKWNAGGLLRELEKNGAAGSSVGIGQMQGQTAAKLLEKYYGEKVTPDEAMRRVASSDSLAINLAAANLRHLKETYGIDDEKAYTAYAADDKLIKAWLRDDSRFEGYGNMTERSHGFAQRYSEANDVGTLVREPPRPNPRPGPSPTPPG